MYYAQGELSRPSAQYVFTFFKSYIYRADRKRPYRSVVRARGAYNIVRCSFVGGFWDLGLTFSSRRINEMNFAAFLIVVVVVVVDPQMFCSNYEMCLNIDVSQLAKYNNILFMLIYRVSHDYFMTSR